MTEPRQALNSFKCPHCHTVAQQNWLMQENIVNITNELLDLSLNQSAQQRSSRNFFNVLESFVTQHKKYFNGEIVHFFPQSVAISTCLNCGDKALWHNTQLVYPRNYSVEDPNDDLPEHIKEIYVEAAMIINESPKGAAALLRLALQELLHHLGYEGKINNSIATLVKEGLNPNVQIALDTLRVVGNNCVHPGQIVFDDNKEDAKKLFSLLNYITDELVTRPKERERLFQDLVPDTTKEHIQQRDRSKPTS